MKFEQDEVEFLGGVRHGRTLGSPVAIRIGNTEWPKWRTVMSPDPVEAGELAAADDVNAEKEIARNRPLTRPRPGHADLVGMQKYAFEDARPVLERASARETAARVALGEVAARVPRPGVRHPPRVAHGGDRHAPRSPRTPRCRPPTTSRRSTPTRCARSTAAGSAAMVAEVDAAHKDGDTLGRRRRGRRRPGCRRASARTCTGTAGSTRASRPR